MYLSLEERAELDILTTSERMQPTLPGVEETHGRDPPGQRHAADPPSIESASELWLGSSRPDGHHGRAGPPVRHSDAPMCMQCGVQMQRAGRCHACPSCGTTSGCS